MHAYTVFPRQRRATKLPLATLDGAEGITAEGSYTWSNQRLLIVCALEKLNSIENNLKMRQK
jgi:hypothetical protein